MHQLSASALGTFEDCHLCFFMDRRLKIPRPRGIYPSLPNGVDGILKDSLHPYRAAGTLPASLAAMPELKDCVLFDDLARLKKMRNWKTNPMNLIYTRGTVVGALDDALIHLPTDTLIPLDYKTKGTKPSQEDCVRYYTRQLNIYNRMIEKSQTKIFPFGVLLYFWPVADEVSMCKFETQAFIVPTNPADVDPFVESAFDVLEKPTIPTPGANCEYCKHRAAVNGYLTNSSSSEKA